MKRAEVVSICLSDCCAGEPQALIGLIDYLVHDCRISLDRLLEIADRKFGIAPALMLRTLQSIYPELIH